MKRIAVAIMLTVWSVALAACGGSSGSTSGGSTAAGTGCDVSGGSATGTVSIGSKNFAEEQLLATIAKLVLQKHGFTVNYSVQAADPAIDRALRNGQIDMLWQYTGTELQEFLGVDKPPTDLDSAFALAKSKDAAAAPPLCWTSKAPMDDTNGIAIKSSDRGRFGSTLSDFSTYLGSHPTTTVCIMSEFRTRADGVPGLQQTYGHWDIPGLKDIGSTAEKGIAGGQCDAGEVFTTDSGIAANDLYVLQDDRKLFPPDNVGLIVSQSVLRRFPSIASLMAPVAAKITTGEITKLNKQVEIDNKNVSDVARAWLQQNGAL